MPAEAAVFQFDQSEALLRKVMENAAAGMALLGVNNRLLYVNAAFTDMLGRDRDTCLGQDIAGLIHPDCDAALLLHLRRLLTGESENHRTECRLRHADGSAVWVLASASELRSEQTGRPLYVILQVMSIERQKRAEAALAYSESRWNFALEAAGQGVWDHDARTNSIFYSNQWRRMRGIPDDEYVDSDQGKWLARLHPDDVDRIRATVSKQNLGEDGFETLEYRERRRDGGWVWILSRGRPVEWDDRGNVLRTTGTDTDITRLKQVETELAAEKELLRVTLQSIGDGVISTDLQRRITFMNPVAERMTGWTAAEAAGQPLQRVLCIVDDATGGELADPIARCLASGEITYFEEDAVLVARDDTRRDIRSSAAPLHDGSGRMIGAVLVFTDITSSRRLQRQLAHSATHDMLTGLPNRAAFDHALSAAVREARSENRTHALCFIDLDRFKPVNDTAGHAAGDAVLKRVGDVIRRACRRQDFAARIGGDEFGALLADCPPPAAERIARRIVEGVGRLTFTFEERVYRIGASIGITRIDAGSGDPRELLSEADAACYVAKGAGRGRFAVYRPSQDDGA